MYSVTDIINKIVNILSLIFEICFLKSGIIYGVLMSGE